MLMLVEEVELDVWGRPYRLIRKRLRKSGPPILESLEVGLRDRVIYFRPFRFPPHPEDGIPLADPPPPMEPRYWAEGKGRGHPVPTEYRAGC